MITADTQCPSVCDTYVLWGNRFDETATAIFVCAFRELGMRVKIVGLAGIQSTGRYQLAISSDLTLGDALGRTAHALCLIVPCSRSILRLQEHDPRLFQLLNRICNPQTRLVLKERDTLDQKTVETLDITTDNVAIYSARDNLLHFAHDLAESLATQVWHK